VSWRNATGIRMTMTQKASVLETRLQFAGFLGGLGMVGGMNLCLPHVTALASA
jgi:hypothetical protein